MHMPSTIVHPVAVVVVLVVVLVFVATIEKLNLSGVFSLAQAADGGRSSKMVVSREYYFTSTSVHTGSASAQHQKYRLVDTTWRFPKMWVAHGTPTSSI